MLDILSYEFMRRAFIVGGILAIILPLIGLPIILKRLSKLEIAVFGPGNKDYENY